jgi:putative flippase GtrA
MPSRQEQFLRFALVGVAGFIVDAGVVALLVRGLSVGAYAARPCSYLFAVATTWWLNRRFTFHSSSPPLKEFAAFLVANAFGAIINLLVYAAIIAWRGAAGWTPVIAVATGSLAGLFTNFFLSSTLVFSKRAGAPWGSAMRRKREL